MSMTIEQRKGMDYLIKELNQATVTYDKGIPIYSDKEWDDMYFELLTLEKETGYISPDSPTQKIHFQTVSELNKIEHNHWMGSLNKTKDIEDIKNFIDGHKWIAMAKMDGLTCSLRYINGKLFSAETRGNGIIGEDITHNAMVIPSIPKKIPCEDEVIIDGEIICTYKDFEQFKDTYKNPRNFAAGSIRLLNSKECAKRNLTFVAWDVIKGGKYEYLSANLDVITGPDWGFYIAAPYYINDDTKNTIEEDIESIKKLAKSYSYPIDGIVFKYDCIKEYNDAGRTDHHFNGGLAYKFYDETYSTRLKHISWSMGRSGVLTPIAIFDPIEIDGTEVSRASLHNVSIMREILGDCAYVGEPLEVYKSNMIIPQIYSAGPKYNYGEVIAAGGVSANDTPEHCPICGGDIYFKTENNITRAYCNNPNCNGKLINRLEHFCSKKGLDIKGLSKATLNKLINWEWLNSISDIFKLHSHQSEWIKKSGFGQTSVSKIINTIEEAKRCSFDKYLCALGIPLIGKVASKALLDEFGCYEEFRKAINNKDKRLYNIYGFGESMITSLLEFDYTEADSIFEKYIIEPSGAALKAIIKRNIPKILEDKIFVITGKTKIFKNRDELKNKIEEYGGKVSNNVTNKTSYLINNDASSRTSKNLTAQKLNIPIITEEELVSMLNI